MKKLLRYLARLIVVSLLFVPTLSLLHQWYLSVLERIIAITLPTNQVMTALLYDSSGSLYTFLVLIIATPEMPESRRIVGIITGISLFLCTDFFMTAIWIPYLKTPQLSLANMAVSYGWLVVAHYLLPFLIWLIFAFSSIEKLLHNEQSLGIQSK